jgi:predicted transcriptional regulator
LLANDYERKKEIQKYFTGIASTLQEFTKEKRERDGSVIYKILSEELNKLSESRAELKKLIINCDLNEKSFINFYDTAVLNSIRNKPEEMRKLLIEKYPLKNLTGIEVFIVYKPQDIYDNERFEIVSNFYKEMLESYGAHVTISGSL